MQTLICWVQCSWATQILLVQGNITLWIVTVECFIIHVHIHYFVIRLLGRKSWAWVGRMNIVSPHTIIIPQYLTKSVLHKKASCNNALIAPLFYMLTFQRNMKNIKNHRQLHDHSQNEAKERIYTCFTMFLISLFAACKSWGFLLCSNFARSYQKRILTSGTIMIQSCLISIPVHMLITNVGGHFENIYISNYTFDFSSSSKVAILGLGGGNISNFWKEHKN